MLRNWLSKNNDAGEDPESKAEAPSAPASSSSSSSQPRSRARSPSSKPSKSSGEPKSKRQKTSGPREWKQDYLQEFKWLERLPSDDPNVVLLRCNECDVKNLVVGQRQSYTKKKPHKFNNKGNLVKHEQNSDIHKRCVRARKEAEKIAAPIEASLEQQRESTWKAKLAQLKIIFIMIIWIVHNNLPITLWESLKSVLILIGVDFSHFPNTKYTSRSIVRDIIDSLNRVLVEARCSVVKAALAAGRMITVCVDESVDISNKCIMIVHFRIFLEGKLHTFLAGMIEIHDQSAQALDEKISTFIRSHNIPEEFTNLGSDGAGAFSGSVQGVWKRRSARIPFGINQHCINHLQQLGVKTVFAVNSYLKKSNEIVNDIALHLKFSARKTADLKAIYEMLDLSEIKLAVMSYTRWLSYSAGIKKFLAALPAVVVFLHNLAAKKSSKEDPSPEKAKAWLVEVSNPMFVYTLCFLDDAMDILNKMSLKMQKRTLETEVKKAIIGLKKLRDGSGATFKTAKQRHDEIKAWAGENLGRRGTRQTKLDEYLLKDLPEGFLGRFQVEVINGFLDTEIPQLKLRLQDKVTKLLISGDIFVVTNWPEDEEALLHFGDEKMAELLSFFARSSDDNGAPIDPLVNKDKVVEQFSDAKLRLGSRLAQEKSIILEKMKSKTEFVKIDGVRKRKNVKGIVSAFAERLREVEAVEEVDYSQLVLLLDLILAIPLSNAEVERLFSLLKIIKNARRNKLTTEKLAQCMRIKVDGGKIEDFDYSKAIEIFLHGFTTEDGKKIERRF